MYPQWAFVQLQYIFCNARMIIPRVAMGHFPNFATQQGAQHTATEPVVVLCHELFQAPPPVSFHYTKPPTYPDALSSRTNVGLNSPRLGCSNAIPHTSAMFTGIALMVLHADAGRGGDCTGDGLGGARGTSSWISMAWCCIGGCTGAGCRSGACKSLLFGCLKGDDVGKGCFCCWVWRLPLLPLAGGANRPLER